MWADPPEGAINYLESREALGLGPGDLGAGEGGENQASFPGDLGGTGIQPRGWGDPNPRPAQGEMKGRSHRSQSGGAEAGEAFLERDAPGTLGPEAVSWGCQLDTSQTAFPKWHQRSVSLSKSLNWKAPFPEEGVTASSSEESGWWAG